MYKKGLLFELHSSVKDAMEPVQHGTYKSKRIKDAKGNSTGVSEDDPERTRNKAWKNIHAKIEKAAKKGKKVVYRVEGRDKKNKAGDRAMERLAAYAAKKHGAGYEEKSLERPTKAGGKKAQKAGKSYDPKKGNYRAHPADDPSGKTKSNKTSRGVKKWNKGRQDGFRSNVKADKKAGHVTVGTLGAGHWNLDEKRKHPRNEAEATRRRVDRNKRSLATAERFKDFPKILKGSDIHFTNTEPRLRQAVSMRQRRDQERDSKAGKEEARMGRKKAGRVLRGGSTMTFRKATIKYNKERREFNQSIGAEGEGFKKLRKEGLNEKRRHPRNEAEQVLRQQDRHQRGVRRAEQLRGLEVAGGTNAPKGHTRKAGNALQRLNQKQDSKAGKENTRVRHVKNHIMMGIRDKDGQLTPKAAKTYVAHRKANLQRKREKRQFNQSMGTEESNFKKT